MRTRLPRRSVGGPQSVHARLLSLVPGAVAYYRGDAAASTAWSGVVGPSLAAGGGGGTAAVAQLGGRTCATGWFTGALSVPASDLTLVCVEFSANGMVTLGDAAAGTNTGPYIATIAGTYYARSYSTGSGLVDTTAVAASPSVKIAAMPIGAAMRSYQNSNTPTTGPTCPTPNATARLTLGAYDGSGNGFAAGGRIAVAAVWARALSSGEVATVNALLGAYYGVSIA